MIAGIAVSNTAEAMDDRLFCLLSIAQVISLCDRLITHSEESYCVCVCVFVCDIQN